MTNKSISQLTAGAAVSATDLLPNVQTIGVGPVKTTALQLGQYVLGPTSPVGATVMQSVDPNVGSVYVGASGASALAAAGSNTALGYQAANSITGGGTTAIGFRSLISANAAVDCTAVGDSTLFSLVTGVGATAIGKRSQRATTVGGNTSVGDSTLYSNVTGTGNIAIGYTCASDLTGPNYNVFIGDGVFRNRTGNNARNVAVGYQAGFGTASTVETGSDNVYIGYNVGLQSTGSFNIFIGSGVAGNPSTNTAQTSVVIGHQAFDGPSVTGSDNTIVGFQSMRSATSAAANVCIGAYSGTTLTTGGQNVFIGGNSGYPGQLATASNSIGIGNGTVTTASNQTILGNSSTTVTRIYGQVLIGSTAPVGGESLLAWKDQAALTEIRIRNANASASAYAGVVYNAVGNSWAIRMGSAAANSNALDFAVDVSGANTTRLTLTTVGNLYGTAGAASMTNGFIYVPSGAGAAGTPALLPTGTVPIYVDTTNNQIGVYYGGGWKYAAVV